MPQSLEWTYLQTPQFTFSSRGTADAPVDRLPGDHDAPLVEFTARYGVVTQCNIQLTPESSSIGDGLVGKRLHEIADWTAMLAQPESGSHHGQRWTEVTEYLQRVLPRV